jgi:hypothetical protein
VLPSIPTLTWGTPQERVLRLAASEEARSVELEAECPDGVVAFEILRDGERSRLEGERVDATHRRLVLSVSAPVELRFRAVSSRGMMSRALHLSVESGR